MIKESEVPREDLNRCVEHLARKDHDKAVTFFSERYGEAGLLTMVRLGAELEIEGYPRGLTRIITKAFPTTKPSPFLACFHNSKTALFVAQVDVQIHPLMDLPRLAPGWSWATGQILVSWLESFKLFEGFFLKHYEKEFFDSVKGLEKAVAWPTARAGAVPYPLLEPLFGAVFS